MFISLGRGMHERRERRGGVGRTDLLLAFLEAHEGVMLQHPW